MVVTHWTHFVREVLCIYECNQLHRYILCIVVVIFCNEHWEQGIKIELTCTKVVALISVNTIWIIFIYLSQNWALSGWRSELPIWMHGIEQTAKVDRLHCNISLSHHKLIRNFNLFQPYKFSKFSDRLYTCIVNNCYTDTQNNLCIIW